MQESDCCRSDFRTKTRSLKEVAKRGARIDDRVAPCPRAHVPHCDPPGRHGPRPLLVVLARPSGLSGTSTRTACASCGARDTCRHRPTAGGAPSAPLLPSGCRFTRSDTDRKRPGCARSEMARRPGPRVGWVTIHYGIDCCVCFGAAAGRSSPVWPCWRRFPSCSSAHTVRTLISSRGNPQCIRPLLVRDFAA